MASASGITGTRPLSPATADLPLAPLAIEAGDAAAAAEVALDTFEAADVELQAASRAACRVERLLDYDLNSASHLEYSGNPKVGKAKKTRESVVVRQ